MYRSCIFCSAKLGANEALERFPVGRSLAFDAAKGRLWAICLRCARWNLAPIEERWEAIEDAERLFRDTLTRVQRENIGLARLRDGTRLVRVGEALPGELAVWRYGETLLRRRRRHLLVGGAVAAVAAAGSVAGIAAAGISLLSAYYIPQVIRDLWKRGQEGRVVHQFRPAAEGGGLMTLRRRDLNGARLMLPETGGIGIHFPAVQEEWTEQQRFSGGNVVYTRVRSVPLAVTGEPARALLARAMVHLNERGARHDGVGMALRRIAVAGSPEAFLRNAALARRILLLPDREAFEPLGNLALEMALHEETERRALEGELAMLEAMWRDAEVIADIADRLPELPAPEPPRLDPPG